MKTQLFDALKVSALAIVISFGLSYAFAWTAPTATPPTGNVSAPINTGTDLQTKAGNLTVANLGANTITLTGTATVNDVYITSIGKWASELFPVNLVNGQHTASQCSGLGGSTVDITGGKLCKLAGASCPAGWVKYQSWSTTSNINTNYIVNGAPKVCTRVVRICSSLSHTWANTAQESVTCSYSNEYCGQESTTTSTAVITETGCY
ncbi:MAG: hypothetical protein UW27_C0011G0010 [Parcubacteria group bacterium GW2011_GWA1_44_13]|uniref:Uncharacterized protein n=1 Tax=Candidatus Nomurabacteria bacterium GW2011_GWB1_44_12 TaxID=1618748 RepID=A0A837I8U3_9BACT|nr:MAG: hypothetical protein UW17_C0004G0003 [Candidatus Nomurabacteria bacterium GW2011_GWD1_44_10]KKT36453.1 MAG: hypothetical protein UW25_C0007G0010 [Candidatus Nomurabacteria bacterium GW2011_GWB1_44_12]KKT37688.1 MAG: hypothetical protein UW27_C0011G0010 [Parcubacteria group bacterium GW2011_GWA1_44_13]HBB44198.1 hypothetical protein [Candidatus Yonathbacteria bacterium]